MPQIKGESELHDENVVEGSSHDEKNAEAQSVDSVNAAAKAVKGKAPARTGDKSNSEPMPKTKAGMISAMYNKMSGMKKSEINATFGKYMGEEVEGLEGDVVLEDTTEDSIVEFNYSNELDALVESEATLSEEFKAKTAVLFEAAVKVKLSEEIDRLEAQYAEELAEEVEATKSELVEKVDSYLNYVVEQWMTDNEVAVQTGLRTEIAEGFMSKLKDVFVESYIEVPDSKLDLVDDLAEQVEELEITLNTTTQRGMDMAEELEAYKRSAIIIEAAHGLADTQAEKLKELAEKIDFDCAETFVQKVATLKETYFKAEKVESTITEDTDQDLDEPVTLTSSMSQYVSALQKSAK